MTSECNTALAFDSQQQLAIDRCFDTKLRLVPVTGQAGTGKTSILKAIYYGFIERGYRTVLAAPTGKAAKRIQEATGIAAMTLHRLLEYSRPDETNPKTGKPYGMTFPKRHQTNPLDYDVILVDEYAMVSHEIHRNLMTALPYAGLVRCFGDVNQLQPIEKSAKLATAPTPFMEMLDKFQGVRLDHIYRSTNSITAQADRILKGLWPQRKEDFNVVLTDKPTATIRKLLEISGDLYRGISAQIITPSNKSYVGTVKLNALIQSLVQPKTAAAYPMPRHSWDENPLSLIVGDKVIWTENDYQLMIFNGETGVVEDISPMGDVTINFGDRIQQVPNEVTYENPQGLLISYDPRKTLQLAYAITTHKAQGSEFTEICYVLNRSVAFMANRKNFYTAVTRAKDKVVLITDEFTGNKALRTLK